VVNRPEARSGDAARDLEILIRSSYPVLTIDTLEEGRLRELLAEVAG
jgi:hypothetical protein